MKIFKSKRPEYRVWAGLKSRCRNERETGYHNYGGRGITYDPLWENFDSFFHDMGPRPSPKHSLDRIDVDGPYCKENCRWATKEEQDNNRRTCVFIEFEGNKRTISQWSRITGINRMVLDQRLFKYGWSIKKALTTPPDQKYISRSRRRT